MDAAQKLSKNTALFLLTALSLAVPASAQTPAFSLDKNTVSLNQSVLSDVVQVTSQGAAITFRASISYASDGGSGAWLRFSNGVTPSTDLSTPKSLGVEIATTAGSTIGSHQATVTLNPTGNSQSSGVQPITFAVNWTNGSGGGGTGGNSISLSKTSSSVSAAVGGTTFDNVTISTTSSSNITLLAPAVTTTSCTNVVWLQATLNNSTINSSSNANLNISASAVGLSAGTCSGTITITPSTGNAATVNVTFTVGGNNSGSLSVTPSNFTMNYNTGTALGGTTQVLNIIDAGATSVTVTVNNNWLTVNGNSTILVAPGQLTVGLSSVAASLVNGSYPGSITFTDNLNNSFTVSVTLTINNGTSAGLTVNPTALAFSAAVNGGNQAQNINVTSNTGGAFSAVPNVNWIQATVSTGNLSSNTQGTVQVTVIPGGLSNAVYQGSVAITVGSQQFSVPVTLTVGSGGGGGTTSSSVAPNSIALAWQTGTDPGFVNRPDIQIVGPNGSWSSSVVTAQGGGWLSLSPASGGILPATATVVVNPTGLTAGSYSGTITITTPGGTQTVNISLSVSASAIVTSRPGSVIFNATTGGSAPPGQSVFFSTSDITLNGSLDLTNSVVANGSWISVTTFQKSIQVYADPKGLTNGLYSGSVTVSPNGFGSMVLPVVLLVDNGTGGGGGAGPLTFSPASMTFSAATGSNPAAQTLQLTSTTTTAFSVTSNQSWLTVTPTSGNSPTTVSVSVTSSNLTAGTYNGVLNFVTSLGTQTVSVALTVSGSGGGGSTGNVTVSPTSLAFTSLTGTGSLPMQSVQVNSAGSTAVSFTVSITGSNCSWLSTNAGSAVQTTNMTLTAVASITGLSAGTYNCNIAVQPSGGTLVTVPVTLTLTPPAQISATPTNLNFTYRAGGATPATQQIQVSGNGGALAFTATAASSGNWLSVSPATGTTPASGTIPVTVSVNPSSLNASSTPYTGTITVAGSGGAPGSTTITVSLTVTAPLPTITRVTNAASYANGNISPGEIVTLFGTDIGPSTPAGLTLDSAGKVATTLANTQVTVNGFLAPLIYVSNTQVSAVVPYEVAQFTSANVLVKFFGQSSNGVVANVSTTQPGLFTLNASGTGPGAILNQNGSTNSPSNPAARGDTIVVYLTGEGQTAPAGVTGKVTTVSATPPLTPAPLLPIGITIGGAPANYSFAGEAPGFVSGVMQLNVTVPAAAGSGPQAIVVSIGGNSSQTGVTVSIQ